MKKNILVTGGCGYLGGGLIRKLLDKGYFVRCLDLMVYGDKAVSGLSNNKNFSLVAGDIRDKKKVNECLKDIDEIVHLAAIVGDKPCEAAPKAAFDINHNGTKILCELAQLNKVKKFVFASTCSNYEIALTMSMLKRLHLLIQSLYMQNPKLIAKIISKILLMKILKPFL